MHNFQADFSGWGWTGMVSDVKASTTQEGVTVTVNSSGRTLIFPSGMRLLFIYGC